MLRLLIILLTLTSFEVANAVTHLMKNQYKNRWTRDLQFNDFHRNSVVWNDRKEVELQIFTETAEDEYTPNNSGSVEDDDRLRLDGIYYHKFNDQFSLESEVLYNSTDTDVKNSTDSSEFAYLTINNNLGYRLSDSIGFSFNLAYLGLSFTSKSTSKSESEYDYLILGPGATIKLNDTFYAGASIEHFEAKRKVKVNSVSINLDNEKFRQTQLSFNGGMLIGTEDDMNGFVEVRKSYMFSSDNTYLNLSVNGLLNFSKSIQGYTLLSYNRNLTSSKDEDSFRLGVTNDKRFSQLVGMDWEFNNFYLNPELSYTVVSSADNQIDSEGSAGVGLRFGYRYQDMADAYIGFNIDQDSTEYKDSSSIDEYNLDTQTIYIGGKYQF